MSLPQVASRDEWLAARKALLAEEKERHRAETAPPPSTTNRCGEMIGSNPTEELPR